MNWLAYHDNTSADGAGYQAAFNAAVAAGRKYNERRVADEFHENTAGDLDGIRHEFMVMVDRIRELGFLDTLPLRGESREIDEDDQQLGGRSLAWQHDGAPPEGV